MYYVAFVKLIFRFTLFALEWGLVDQKGKSGVHQTIGSVQERELGDPQVLPQLVPNMLHIIWYLSSHLQ